VIAPMHRKSCQDVRTLFVSDTHLGSRHAQSEPFLQMLRSRRPRQLYLVGDIVDGWRWPDAWIWKESLISILEILEDLADAGTEIYYTPGNHDAFLRNPEVVSAVRRRLPFLNIADEFIHTAADGRRFLVTHGDHFDVVERTAQWLSKISSWAYDTALSTNWWVSRWLGNPERSPYWLCASGKKKVKTMIKFLSQFESSILDHARRLDCQGVICGHLHTPAMIERDGMTYFNSGDWVENCTSLIESEDGEFDIESFYPWTHQYSVIRRQDLPPQVTVRPSFASLDLMEEPVLPM
jgi:UDP-2,3-diacylglucosamine pyrophosphatase LpxH